MSKTKKIELELEITSLKKWEIVAKALKKDIKEFINENLQGDMRYILDLVEKEAYNEISKYYRVSELSNEQKNQLLKLLIMEAI